MEGKQSALVPCVVCGGTGKIKVAVYPPWGKGGVVEVTGTEYENKFERVTCPTCEGSGKTDGRTP